MSYGDRIQINRTVKSLALILLLLFLSCENKNVLQNNYELDYDPNHEIDLVISKYDYQLVIIPGHILFYGHNKDFIILNQKPADSIYSIEENLNHLEAMAKIYRTELSQYWIVTLSNDSVHGPFSKDEYLLERKKLNIPSSMKLNFSTLEFFERGKRNDIEYSKIDTTTIDVENLIGNKYFN